MEMRLLMLREAEHLKSMNQGFISFLIMVECHRLKELVFQ